MALQQLLGVATPAGSQPSPEADKIAGQRRTLTNWVNTQLKKGRPSARTVSNLMKDFEDGELLIHLLESLAVGKEMPGKYYAPPRTNIQKVQNLAIAFRFMKEMEKIPLPDLSPTDLLQHRLQPILDLLWSIFLHYNFDLSKAPPNLGQRQREAKRLLLQWLRGTLPDRNISNLTTDWSDGVNISALVNSCRPGLLSKYASLNRNKGERNVQKALDLAHGKLGVPQVLEAMDMASGNPDERCVILYLSYFPKLGQKSLSEWASHVIPASPEKVKVINIRLPDEPGAGTKLAWVEIDCSEAGHGLIRGEALGSKGEAVTAAVDDLGDDKYRVQFSLSQPDLYRASIHYGEGQITGSPFSLNMLPPDADLVQHLGTHIPEGTGDAVTLAFDTKNAGRGKLSAQATNESGETIPVEVEQNLDGTFKVLFVPPEPDVYTVDVNWGQFSVQGEDLGGNELTVAVQQKPDCDCKFSFGVPKLRTDTYKVTVLWEGRPVPGSPFQVDLLIPAKPENVETGMPIFTSILEPLDIPIDVSEAGSGVVTAHCVGEISGEVPVTISGPKRSPYMVSFTPLHADLFTLSILFNKSHIRRSPFVIDLRKGMMTIQEEPEEKAPVVEEAVEAVPIPVEESLPEVVDASKCKILGWEKFNERLIVRQPVTVSVDTRGAGLGQLQVSGKVPVGEKESLIDIRTREDEPEIYDVTYTPHAVGTHALDFRWSDHPIPDAAVSFKVSDDERVQTYIHGHPINLELDSESRLGDLKSYAVHEDTNTQHKVRITKAQRGKYRLNFQPKEPGIYQVHILAKDKPISGSPVIVRYGRPPKPEAIRVNGLQKKCFLGEPLVFTVDCSEAGSGELSIRATAPKAKKDKSELKIKDNKDGSFQVEYTPVSLGDHSLAVTWSGMPAPGSPYHVAVLEEEPKALVTDASRCVVVGIDKLPNLLQVGKEIAFMVDTSSAGAGELEGTVECPDQDEPPKIHIGTDEKDRNMYRVNFTPMAPGLYRLHFKWGGDGIPKSPLSFDIADIQTVAHGKPMGLEFGADCKLGDILAYAIHEESNARHKVKVDKGQKGKFKLSLQPTEPGVYAIHVLIRNKEISGSPFRIKLRKPPQPENCKVLDFPKEGQVGYYSTFIIDARDAGSGELGIKSTAPSSPEKPHLSVVDLKNRTFRVEYIPNVPGDHQFHITWTGQPVPGSPYQLPVTVDEEYANMEWKAPVALEEPNAVFLDTIAMDASPEERKPTELTTYVGKVLKVKIKPQADLVGKAELVVTVKGDSTGVGKAQVVNTPDRSFVMSFNPSVPDRYTVDMTLNNEPVPKTPIIATYLPPPSDPSKVRLLGVEDIPIPPVADQPIHFQVDVRDAGAGTLGIVAKLSQPEPRPKIQVHATKEEPRVIEVEYTPNTSGLHSIVLNWAKKEIPGSPIQLSVSEPQKEESLEDTMASLFSSMPPRIDWEEPTIAGVGEPVELPLEVANSRPGELTATCSGEECGQVPVGVYNPSPTKYKFSFTPPVPDLYTIHAYQDGDELKGSPYTVDLRQKVRPPSFVEEAFEEEIATIEESALPWPSPFLDFGSPAREDEEEETVLEDEPEVQPMEEFTTYVGRALLVKVRPETEEQRKGELVATATGERTGPVDISVSRKSEDLFLVAFNPKKPDRYTIEAKLNGTHIPRSPLLVNYVLPPPDASKCTILGLHDLPEVLEVHNEIPLVVDATRAGNGLLDVHVDGPTKDREPHKLEVSPTEEDPARFQVNYLPTAPGTHTINLQWSDKHIPGSPVKLVVVDMASVETRPFGVPFAIDVGTDCKPSELKAYAIHEGTKTPLKVKATRVRRDKYKLTFSPTGHGLYYIHVLARDKEVQGSPFVVRIAEPPKPEAVTVEGLSNRGYVGEVVNFTINGTKAGSGEPNVKALGPGRKERGNLRLQDNKDKTYAVEYKPSVPGNHQFQVSWAGKAVPGSPYPLQVRERADEELFVDLYFKDRVGSLHSVELPGEETEGAVPKVNATTDNVLVWNIKARTNEQKNGTLVATATGDRVGPAEVKVSKPTGDTFEILFNPPEPDHYTVEAQLNGQPVPLTPVAVNYTTPAADISLIKVIGLENIPPMLQVEKEIPFKVDTRLAGEGTLGFTADTPEGEKKPVQLQVREDEPHIHSVTYTPTVPGSHTLNLTWGEGSTPLNFEVSPVQLFPHGKPMSLEISTDAKPGDVDSYAVHKDTATKYKVKIHKVQKGHFKLSFQPKEPGLYAVHVLVKKKDISGSPFYLRYNKPADATACVVRGLDKPGYVLEPLKFVIDCSDAGTGDLGLGVSGPEPLQDGQVSIMDNHNGTFSGVFEPHVKGDHTFNVTWSGKSVPGSPFTVNVNRRITDEWKKCFIAEKDLVLFSTPQIVGTPIDFAVSAQEAGEGEITAFVDGPSKPDVTVNNNRDGTFSCHVSPPIAGKYDLSILWEGYHIKGSPIPLYMKPSPILKGVDLEGQRFQTGLPQNFTISCEKVGKGVLDVRCDPPTAADVRITPDAEVANSYSCQFLPKEVGDHRISVMYNEMHVQGSPFNVQFIQPSPANMTFTLSGEGIDTSGVSATLESTATSQEVPITLNQLLGGQYGLEFTPTQGLEYMLTLRCLIKIRAEEQKVQGSPFVLDYTSDAVQCIARGEGLSRAEIGEWSKFVVDTSSAGDGELTVDITGEGDKPEVSISRISQREYEISYRLTAQGSYQLAVYWGGKLIMGSPFTIECSETRKHTFQVLQLPTNVLIGHPIEFEVKSEGTEEEDGGVTASATLPSGEVVTGDVTSEGGGSYKCAIKTTESGTYSIDLFFGGRKILQTPIQIVVLSP